MIFAHLKLKLKMKKILALLILTLIFSCGEDGKKLTVEATVKGLKKGTVYLKKVVDTNLVTVDSVTVNGDSNFTLQTDIDEPEVFHLYLDKNSKENDRISFFGDKGVTKIYTKLENFNFYAKIEGSKQQALYQEYLEMMNKINNKNLDIFKENLDALKNKDSVAIAKTEKALEGYTKRKYLYAVNFAINNKDSEVAPYIALSEIYDARLNLLDTINKVLTPEIKNSKYGKQLEEYITERKAEENE